MAQPKPNSDLLTVAEYLAGENDGTWRHEFVNGMVYAMAGSSERHNVIKLNVAGLLNASIAETCRVFDGDMKLRVESKGEDETRYYYPDIFASCNSGEDDAYFRTDAVLVMEVLSPTTKRADRYEKFDAYKKIPSLAEYGLIEQEFPQVELFRRKNGWRREVFRPGEIVALESINQSLTFDQIYRRVGFAL